MSEMWKRKMRTYFSILDLDQDGVVSKKDHECMVEGLVAMKKDDPVHQEKLRKFYNDSWLAHTGSTKTWEKKFLTEALFIDCLMKQRNDPKLVTSVRDNCGVFFDVMDTKKDGYLHLEEFIKGFGKLGFGKPIHAEHAFKVIDTNHDGKISLDECTRAFLEFMFCQDEESPYNYYFGYLL